MNLNKLIKENKLRKYIFWIKIKMIICARKHHRHKFLY